MLMKLLKMKIQAIYLLLLMTGSKKQKKYQ